MEKTSSLPILLIGYNRPELLFDRLNEIKLLPVEKLYISIDSMDHGVNPEIMEIVNEFVDSEPNIQIATNFESQNLGLTRHITSAISRVLQSNEAVLVIEDDTSFSTQSYKAFNEGYFMSKNMEMTGIVSGFSPLVQPTWCRKNIWRKTPYFFVWGWVATQQNWIHYNFDISGVDISIELKKSRSWNRLSRFQKSVWLSRFRRAQLDPLLTWDVQMQYLSFQQDYVNLTPLFRVVENLGFNDSRAAHTKSKKPRWFITSDPKNSIAPETKMKRSIDRFANIIDSITLAGDSKILHLWTHKIRKKLLKY